MQSIWDEQTIKPHEIVLVEDGPLTQVLYSAITRWEEKLKGVLKTVPIQHNVGLGEALQKGLLHCTHEIVARMDTDDIAAPTRFEVQLAYFAAHPKTDIISSWIDEFESDAEHIVSSRPLPLEHTALQTFAKKRNPLNHPAVMFRKDAVLQAGNYQPMPGFEDYYLWVRMLMNGSKMANIPQYLVHMRAGEQQLQRRRGLAYIRQEISFQQKLLSIGFISHTTFVYNVVLRTGVRLLPKSLLKQFYRLFRR